MPRNFLHWQGVMEEFNREVIAIENEAKDFIQESFKKLRSAEGAFDMLLRFKNIRSRETINNEMMKKFTDILTQYVKECDLIYEIFKHYNNLPPLYKNYPAVSGAIAWSRFLFRSIKNPMLKFLTVEQLMNTEQGKETKNHYLGIAKQMKAYEDLKYHEWKLNVENSLPDLLKTNILIKLKDKMSSDLILPANKDPETGKHLSINSFESS